MRNVALAVAAAALAACAAGPSASARPDGSGRGADAPPSDASDRGRVSIPPEVTDRLDAWMADEVTLLGDTIEIRATRVPFTGQIAIESSRETDAQGRRAVERTETRDPETGFAILTLVNRSGFATAFDALPRVRLGGGRQFVATDRIVIRNVPTPGVDRPVTFTATATGRARLIGERPARRLAGERIVVRGDIVRGAAGYEFTSAEDSR